MNQGRGFSPSNLQSPDIGRESDFSHREVEAWSWLAMNAIHKSRTDSHFRISLPLQVPVLPQLYFFLVFFVQFITEYSKTDHAAPVFDPHLIPLPCTYTKHRERVSSSLTSNSRRRHSKTAGPCKGEQCPDGEGHSEPSFQFSRGDPKSSIPDSQIFHGPGGDAEADCANRLPINTLYTIEEGHD